MNFRISLLVETTKEKVPMIFTESPQLATALKVSDDRTHIVVYVRNLTDRPVIVSDSAVNHLDWDLKRIRKWTGFHPFMIRCFLALPQRVTIQPQGGLIRTIGFDNTGYAFGVYEGTVGLESYTREDREYIKQGPYFVNDGKRIKVRVTVGPTGNCQILPLD